MWKGHLLEILGLGLIVTAFLHYDSSTTAWIDLVSGGLIALLGTSLWHSTPRRGVAVNILGVALLLAACVPALRVHSVNIWVGTIAGALAWLIGKRVVGSESGGPWRLKDRPVL